jgi:hypothetical protein
MGERDRVIPAARVDLLVQELQDETLVYDRVQHRAHCLNRTAALVWRFCDGRRTVTELMRCMESELGAPVDDQLVWHALDQLAEVGLLAGPLMPAMTHMSRRELIRKSGIAAAVALPLITSITAPTAAGVISGGPTGPTGPTGETGPTGPIGWG